MPPTPNQVNWLSFFTPQSAQLNMTLVITDVYGVVQPLTYNFEGSLRTLRAKLIFADSSYVDKAELVLNQDPEFSPEKASAGWIKLSLPPNFFKRKDSYAFVVLVDYDSEPMKPSLNGQIHVI